MRWTGNGHVRGRSSCRMTRVPWRAGALVHLLASVSVRVAVRRARARDRSSVCVHVHGLRDVRPKRSGSCENQPVRCSSPPRVRDMTSNVIVIDHPLVQHKLTHLRQKERSTNSFRSLLAEISILLAYEVRATALVNETIETPFATMALRSSRARRSSSSRSCAPVPACSMACWICLRRASVTSACTRSQDARGGRVLLQGAPEMAERDVIIVDPMLATETRRSRRSNASSEPAKVDQVRVRARRARGSPTFTRRTRTCPIYTAAIDERLDERGYIVPGIGDAGDRLFGTK